MKYILASLALAAITLSIPNRSTAGVYIDISGGVSLLNDWEATETLSNAGLANGDYDETYKFENGRAFYFEIGKKTDNRMLGLLLGTTYNEISEVEIEGPGTFTALNGTYTNLDSDVFGIPVLGTFGFATQISENLSFNLGIGAGVNFVVATTGLRSASNIEDIDTVNDMVFQFQAKAGLDLLLTENISLGLDYRFSASTSPEFENEVFGILSTTEGDMLFGHFIGLGLTIAW